jgi:hypothetical protein
MPRIYTVISKVATDFPEWMPNASSERRGQSASFVPVRSTAWFGPYAAAQPYNGKKLLSVSGISSLLSAKQGLENSLRL